MKTVGELKTLIKDLPDDMPLAFYHNDMERCGHINDVYAEIANFKSVTDTAVDAFDGTVYSYDKLEYCKDGTPHLKIYG